MKLQDGTMVTADNRYIRESIENLNAKVVAGYRELMPSCAGYLSEA